MPDSAAAGVRSGTDDGTGRRWLARATPSAWQWNHRRVRLVGELLDRAARAVPVAVEDRGTGWWFRHTDNDTWWSGAVLAHGAADRLGTRIDAAERFYAERDAVARFQVCAGCPDVLRSGASSA